MSQAREDGVCPFCAKGTDSLSANPGRWPLRFTLPGGSGESHSFHVTCVTDRLFWHSAEHEEQLAAWRAEGVIRS